MLRGKLPEKENWPAALVIVDAPACGPSTISTFTSAKCLEAVSTTFPDIRTTLAAGGEASGGTAGVGAVEEPPHARVPTATPNTPTRANRFEAVFAERSPVAMS